MWARSPFNSNCVKVWDLRTSAETMKDDLYPTNTGSWDVRAYNKCARDYGVDPRVTEIEKQCLGDNPDQCIDLGQTAASMIVYQNVCMTDHSARYQSYLESCRVVAIDICKGSITDKIKVQCPSKSITTDRLVQLMGMCEGQVNSMVPDSTPDRNTPRPTKKPTKKPTRRPTNKPNRDRDGRGECRGGSPYASGSFCYNARQSCCSSVKKYGTWQTFCQYYGLPYPSELSGGIAPWIFATVDCTMCGSKKCPSDDIELDIEDIEAELDGGVDISGGEDNVDLENQGMEDEDMTYKRPTKKPTKKPNRNDRDGRGECRGGYPYESGSFCFKARQQCCSSVKKYDTWESFCLYYGLPDPAELSGGIAPWIFATVDCTMCGSKKCPSDDIELDIKVIEAELDGGVDISGGEDNVDRENEGTEDVDMTYRRPTKKPTKKPNRNDRDGRGECRGGYPYESGSFCFKARQQCCSSVKKYDTWESFCLYYGLPDPAELSGGIAPWIFATVDCTMCGSKKCPSDGIELDIEVIEAELDGNDIFVDEGSADFDGEDFEDAFVAPQ